MSELDSMANLADLLDLAAKALRTASRELSAVPRLKNENLDKMLSDLAGFDELSCRVRKSLKRSDPEGGRYRDIYCKSILTVDQLVNSTARDLMERKNFGVLSLREVRTFMAKNGLRLKGDME